MSSAETALAERANSGSSYVSHMAFAIAASATPLKRTVRGLRANTAGTITVRFAGQVDNTNDIALNFAAGETRYFAITHVLAATATGIEGIV